MCLKACTALGVRLHTGAYVLVTREMLWHLRRHLYMHGTDLIRRQLARKLLSWRLTCFAVFECRLVCFWVG